MSSWEILDLKRIREIWGENYPLKEQNRTKRLLKGCLQVRISTVGPTCFVKLPSAWCTGREPSRVKSHRGCLDFRTEIFEDALKRYRVYNAASTSARTLLDICAFPTYKFSVFHLMPFPCKIELYYSC